MLNNSLRLGLLLSLPSRTNESPSLLICSFFLRLFTPDRTSQQCEVIDLES